FQRAPFDHPSIAVPNGPSLPAVGKNGGAEIKTFLNLDPFAATTNSSPIVVAEVPEKNGNVAATGQDSSGVTLVSYPNRGKDFMLLASFGDEAPKGTSSPTPADIQGLMHMRGLQVVTTGTLDSIGAASVPVDAAPTGTVSPS